MSRQVQHISIVDVEDFVEKAVDSTENVVKVKEEPKYDDDDDEDIWTVEEATIFEDNSGRCI